MKTYILDTNIILDNVENIFKLQNSENKIVIPETVVDELDTKKTDMSELGYRAREFARFLGSLEFQNIKKENGYNISTFKNENISIEILGKETYISDDQFSKSPAILADRRIIETCKYYPDGIFITLDNMCRIRATIEGIKTQTFGETSNSELDYNFIKEIDDDYATENMDIYELDPEYKPENYNYLIRESNGNLMLGRCVNNRLRIIDEKYLEKQDIRPLNLGQKFYVDSILDENINICLVEATSGSGKTILALSSAMRLINDKKYNGIVYIRNSINSTEKNEEVGFLSGNEEKFAVFNHPLYDCLKMIAETQLTKSNNNKSNAKKCEINNDLLEEKTQELIKRYNIETMWNGELRGRTIQNKIVIWDESQNCSVKTGLLILSRLDKNCKVIICGSNRQIDNPFVNKYNNALTILLKSAYENHQEVNLSAVNLTKTVRGPIPQYAERVLKVS